MVSKDDVVTARDSLEYWEGERKAVARGAAQATHEDKQIKADVLTAIFEEDAQGELAVHRLDAVGNVEILTAEEYASGRQGTYFVEQEMAPLAGEVKLPQGEHQLDRPYAQLNMAPAIPRLQRPPPAPTAHPPPPPPPVPP